MSNSNRKKIVLVIGGHDPSGGAGIQADIEAIGAANCRAVSIVTALTTQSTQGLMHVIPQQPAQLQAQLQCLLDDMPIDACKIGLLGAAPLVPVIIESLQGLHIPLVVDPILRSGSGTEIADDRLIAELCNRLLPKATLVTPNSEEARRLTDCDELHQAAEKLLKTGAESVLVTGTHEPTGKVINTLYLPGDDPRHREWSRLPETYHGSGCTLAAHAAALLAKGLNITNAAEQAQSYTWHTLQQAEPAGKGQWLPNRFLSDE